jgi:glutamate racemase
LRPTTEIAGSLTRSGHLGLLATRGTVESDSYRIEIKRMHPQVTLHQQACPLWVSLIEEGRLDSPLTEMAVKECVDPLYRRAPAIDALVLGCTHFPLLAPVIRRCLPPHVEIIEQGPLVAQALGAYLDKHTGIESSLKRNATCTYLTTEDPRRFDRNASLFVAEDIRSRSLKLRVPSP